ncbi:MAG: acetylornithine deacetylase [Rhodospirillaceae bacterium]|jgi:acetylornithine deacetylase|nr:acetylornithine deacetylase [Rhodospirillaceae bacterium]MBT5193249.1 acetylornithine deacetylase [Rhodospirillaceae bacterium]MBT5896338.1 acetylornithine deacetylase [Rhodospirillaceae bacterium]MBT6426242.1 acetylornithine deacetylase [Rhodospirillaceae bacterium]
MAAQTFTPREMIDRLVAFDTTSRESNLGLIHFVRDYLADHGVESTLIHDKSGAKANLFATVGPMIDGGVVLSGHTDVVPVDGQDWSTDPFLVTERDGRLYGRGTADMKSFIAIALALVPDMVARGLSLPIHFALSYDEEVGCLGAPDLSRHLQGLPCRPQALIVGEPTEMKVVNAHKGCCAIRTIVTGLEGHSSETHKGVNSIFAAAKLVNYLSDRADELQTSNVNPRFDPPYTTIQVGTIQGGTAGNIIPKETTFWWEYRALPDVDGPSIVTDFRAFAEAEVLPRMRKTHPEADIKIDVRGEVIPLLPEDGSPAETLVLALTGSNQTYAVSYGTEAGIFQKDGVASVICGPGSISVAHRPDEYIEISQVEACTDLMHKLINRLA